MFTTLSLPRVATTAPPPPPYMYMMHAYYRALYRSNARAYDHTRHHHHHDEKYVEYKIRNTEIKWSISVTRGDHYYCTYVKQPQKVW